MDMFQIMAVALLELFAILAIGCAGYALKDTDREANIGFFVFGVIFFITSVVVMSL